MKHFLSARDAADIDSLVQLALQYKTEPLLHGKKGAGRRLGLLFLNPSLRTRLSSQIAAQNLGMEVVVFNAGADGWKLEFEDGAVMNGSSVEHIRDAAPVLGSYFDVLGVRTFPGLQDREADYAEVVLNQFVKYCGVPVVSLESATLHPLQSLTDILTMVESEPAIPQPKVVLTWAPHVKALPQCVANSFAQWVNQWGKANFYITHPPGYELAAQYTKGATITHDQQEAFAHADFIYVKNWSSYNDYGAVLPVEADWMPTPQTISGSNDARVMHCLPVRRNVELSDAILDSSSSIVTRQASNRVWAAQAVLSRLLDEII